MNDELSDPQALVFTYPVYFLLDPSPPISFASRPLIGMSGYGIHIFTDEPAADDYLARNPQPPGVVKHAARNRATFVGKLAILAEQNTFTHLIVDDLGGEPGPKRCIAIKDLLEHFNRRAT
jgi:hypothetical protein